MQFILAKGYNYTADCKTLQRYINFIIPCNFFCIKCKFIWFLNQYSTTKPPYGSFIDQPTGVG